MALEGLKGFEFDKYFNKIDLSSQLFFGVYSIDLIPIIPIKHFVICNLSPSNEPGTHWIVILRPDNTSLEIFNSLGYKNLDTLKPHLKNFSHSVDLEFNYDQFQPDDSTYCGYFCIYFAIHRVLNYDLSFVTILEDYFSSNKNNNNELVYNYCQNLLHENVFLVYK
jgi:hypothetical protein